MGPCLTRKKYNDWTIVPKLFHATILVGRRPTDDLRSYAVCILLVGAYMPTLLKIVSHYDFTPVFCPCQ